MGDERLSNRQMETLSTTLNAKGGLARAVRWGEETPILEETQDWTLAPRGIYFVKPRPEEAICFFDFSTHSLTPVVPIEKNKAGSVAVSSDGRRLLYTQPDDSDIMLLDNGG